MEIIIIGAGKVGMELTKQLAADHNVTVVDQNAQLVQNIINIYDVMGVCGNGAGYEVQMEAQVDKAELLIATTSSDEINILACLVAKKLGVKHTIARIRNPEYEKQLRFMREEMGLSMSINPEKAAAHEIARVLRFPAAMKVETFSKGRLELIEYRLPEASVLDGVKLLDLYKSIHARVLICAVDRKGETTIPSGDFVLRAGDKIYLTAAPEQLAKFFRHLGVFRDKASTVMIVGASKICYYLASELLAMGMSVKVIDQNEQRCVEMGERLPGALVIVGDGTDSELLMEEGIEETDAFVAITGIDEANILMGMRVAREYGDGCKVVAKINRRSLVELVSAESMIDSVVSAATVTTELIVQYVRAMESASGAKIKTLHRLVDGAVEALEFSVPADAPFIGITLKDLKLKSGLLLAGIVRGGRIIIPSGSDALQAKDDVIVVTTGTLQEVGDILE
ncbi:MAG: Trk system potassium transporter TrkA [Ruminococcaceae bacterium]|nr:Trk system potassium transporter TrkA [Oscillospiraceae bacterium]